MRDKTYYRDLTMAKSERMKKARALQWMNLEEVWCRTGLSVDVQRAEADSLTDGEKGPSDGGSSCGVALTAGESVGGSGRLEEYKGEEDKDLGPDSGLVGVGVDTECLEEGKDDQDDGPFGSARPKIKRVELAYIRAIERMEDGQRPLLQGCLEKSGSS
jgi:hypothetical protein